MEPPLTLSWVPHGSPEQAALLALRDAVLRKPLGLRFSPEQLSAEAAELHLGAWEDGRAVGCLVLRPLEGGVAQMRQVAVTAERQGRGVGRLLVEECEREAARRGWRRIVLHARQEAVPFYERLGYRAEGEPFVEIGLPHRLMAKAL